MRLATWNINGTRARLEFVLHWLKARQPDLVGLQELKLQDEAFPHAELEAAGYTALTHGQKSWNGVAILSRKPASLTQTGLPGQEEMGARLISAEIDGISFTSVYVPNGKTLEHADYARKLEWLDGLTEHFRAHHKPDQQVVLCGDFNVCPAAIDSWNDPAFKGAIFHTEEERQRMQAFADWGFVDLFRRVEPDLQKFSWWDYRAGSFHKGQGLRIDLVLGTPSIAERVKTVEIDRDYRKKQAGLTPSDHAPVIVDIGD